MRPIKLKMAAFGPYGEIQTIDFREATDAGLFGIYGPTGSGKSSIFSAMTFALFGEAAKKEQPIVTLRSAHAPADLQTEVAFVFELGAKRYLVRRQPEQTRPKVRGDGETSQAHAAWLFDVTDIEVEAIDLDGCGVLLAEKKVGHVGDRIGEILGYGAEQFRQIVLLPQGRFEKFLTSDSSERLKILRELFDVSLYRTITERLKEEAIAAKRAVQDGYRVHAQRLQAEGFASSDDLEAGIEEAQVKCQDAAAESAEKESAASRADEAYTLAQTVDARFVEAERAQQKLAALVDQESEIAAIRRRGTNARLAQRALDKAQAIEDADAHHLNALKGEVVAASAAAAAKDHLAKAAAVLDAERGRAGEIEALQRKQGDYERYKQALADAEDLKDELDKATASKELAEQEREKASLEVERLEELCEEREKTLTNAQQSELSRLTLQTKLVTAEAKLNHARDYRKAREAVGAAENTATRAAHELSDSENAYAAAKASCDRTEAAYFAAQASILAHRLEHGAPCPVCGAEEHPKPARGEGDPADLEDELGRAREELSSASDQLNQAKAAHGSAMSLLKDKNAALAELAPPAAEVSVLAQDFEAIETELSQLGEPKEIQVLQTALGEAKGELSSAKQAFAEAQKELQLAVTAEAVAGRSYSDQIADVPEQFRDPDELRVSLHEVTRLIATRQQELADAEEDARVAREQAATANANFTNAQKAMTDARGACERARLQFRSRLAELGLSAEQYIEFVADVPEIESLAAAVEAFDSSLREAKGAARQATEAIKDVQRPNLSEIAELRVAARLAASEALEAAASSRARLDALKKLKAELATELGRLRQLEEETGPLRTLAEAFSGQNEMNTTLESFAIGAMFDQVLEAANLRLEPMTSGRYRLERDTESSGGRSKRGLDIRIHDIETGRPRDLTTLSGGETFIAALSLALGLSDIVEASHGAIRLDTIFIDEGFGSLDTENDTGTLDRVLQVLQDIVGASRAVGLISHVPLVQQAVPNGFTILKGVGGSTIERRAA